MRASGGDGQRWPSLSLVGDVVVVWTRMQASGGDGVDMQMNL